MNRFAKRLDRRLDEIEVFHELTEAEEIEFKYLDKRYEDYQGNMTLSNISQRLIARREKEFGIEPDESKSIEERRSVIVARYRGQGTTTPSFIKNVARSFKYGEIELNETDKPYHIKITFESIYGIPSNMSDFINAIEEVKPAHLIFDYVYKYLTWNDYESYNKSWDEWDTLNLSWDELETFDGKGRMINA